MLQARGSKSSVSRYVRSPRRCWNLEGPDTTLDTRLSYRDGCSIMSTCSTCRPLQLNRSPDYPMTHNARLCWPLRLYVKSYTRIQACKHNADWGTRAPSCSPLLPDRPHSLPPLCSYCLSPATTTIVVAERMQVCSFADYCGPLSNSRHVKAILGILLIVMQSRLPASANRTGS